MTKARERLDDKVDFARRHGFFVHVYQGLNEKDWPGEDDKLNLFLKEIYAI